MEGELGSTRVVRGKSMLVDTRLNRSTITSLISNKQHYPRTDILNPPNEKFGTKSLGRRISPLRRLFHD